MPCVVWCRVFRVLGVLTLPVQHRLWTWETADNRSSEQGECLLYTVNNLYCLLYTVQWVLSTVFHCILSIWYTVNCILYIFPPCQTLSLIHGNGDKQDHLRVVTTPMIKNISTNICKNEFICLVILEYSNIFQYLQCKDSKNFLK